MEISSWLIREAFQKGHLPPKGWSLSFADCTHAKGSIPEITLRLDDNVAATVSYDRSTGADRVSYKSTDPDFRECVNTIFSDLERKGKELRSVREFVEDVKRKQRADEKERALLSAFAAFKTK